MLCNKKNGLWFTVAFGILVALGAFNQSHAATTEFEGMAIEVRGQGATLIFIPGLNSGTETFSATCDYFQPNYRCHLVQLPGFAGLAPGKSNSAFLNARRDALINYVKQKTTGKITLIGHSLGGTLSLMIALKAPELIDKLIIVDALPFFPALQNPSLTTELVRPQAEQMRTMMNNQTQSDYQQNAAAQLHGMSNNPARMPLLLKWSKTSDRATTTQALYDLMTTDLRADLARIEQPTLVLGAWAAYKAYGSTKDSTQTIFQTQYASLKDVDIRLSESGYHFLTWDDPEWVNEQIQQFLQFTK
ncbi:alpha/beta fold hydrolase [Cellvibrio sp. OA-2007]|uniref:alpha/beta fold hydrolase n=1 Tax=Cellvibrio sp. OA-2007 TaxID=529823 RepID=UPI000782D2E8|nr:alpha/beta hydrolase [Cellvibrio sp. OA-2007]